jgi:hypothetical protein
MSTPSQRAFVKAVTSKYPAPIRKKILQLRKYIYEVAKNTEGVGTIEESLKWNEPTYTTTRPKSGTPIRLAWHKKTPDKFGLYVNCQTSLIQSFCKKYPAKFEYDKTRGIIFSETSDMSSKEIREFIKNALTYYL